MKIAFNSYTGFGAWFARKLALEKHQVTYFNSEPETWEALKGLVPKPKQPSKIDYSIFDLSVFDLTGRPKWADHSLMGCPTIGDGIFHCKLEDDRQFGIEVMEAAGINVPPYETFQEPGEAKAFIKKTGKRYVYKPFTPSGQEQDTDTTYVSKSAEDMLGYIDKLFQESLRAPFILQEFISGTEIGIEGWFNGEDFYLLNATLEEKKFMNDNKGPNTGCSGNLLFTISRGSKIYREGLEKVTDIFRGSGFRGMVDLNTIVTAEKAYGLEWTPRFGYDSSATLARMYGGDYGEMLASVATGAIPYPSFNAEFGASVRLSCPPYPTEIKGEHPEGLMTEGLDPDRDYIFDIRAKGRGKDVSLETAGLSGFLAAPIAIGNDPVTAFERLDSIVDGISFPDMQYRTDVQKSTLKRYHTLKSQGWI